MLKKINDSIINSMKSKNDFKKDVLKMLKTDLLMNVKVGSPKTELEVIMAYHKKLKKAVEDPKFQSKTEFIDKTKKEMKIVEEFLPEELSKDKIIEITKKHLHLKKMGDIMKEIKKDILQEGYSFDGRIVSQIVKNIIKDGKND